MKLKKKRILLIIITAGLSFNLFKGLRFPPKLIQSNDISIIQSVIVNGDRAYDLTEKQLTFWSGLEFEIVDSEDLGATPDFVIDLIGTNVEFTTMYNKGSEIIFFSFIQEIQYVF